MVSTQQQDEIDDLLVDYLTALDLYQAAQAKLGQSLKRGYFDLARSKQALGPLRMSQNSYDLGETLSRVQVTIAPTSSSSPVDHTNQTEPDLDWSLGPSPSSLAPSPTTPPPTSAEPLPSSTLRQRTTLSTSQSSSSSSPPNPNPSSSSSSEPTPPPRPLSRSPLLQFSAFPPPALRSAQAEFSQVATQLVELVQAKRRVQRLERRVGEARTSIGEE